MEDPRAFQLKRGRQLNIAIIQFIVQNMRPDQPTLSSTVVDIRKLTTRLLKATCDLDSNRLGSLEERTQLHFVVMVPDIQLVSLEKRHKVYLSRNSGKLVSDLIVLA